jgi:hypothetical protein
MNDKKTGFPVWPYVVSFIAIVLFATWPVISVYFTYLVADANGCTVNEATVHPCMIWGSDWGELLYTTGVLGWFMLATVPLGALALIAWLVVLVVHIVLYRRRRAQRPQ